MRFSKLTINDWKMFETLEIQFDPTLTILTGANGSGKTTLLNLLARHFGWQFKELSTPAKDKCSGKFRFFTMFFKDSNENNDRTIGEIQYDNGPTARLSVPDTDTPQYLIDIKKLQEIIGLNIPSHRSMFKYSPVSSISTKRRSKEDAFNLVSNSTKQLCFGDRNTSSVYFIKETLLTWAIYGYGNQVIEPDQEQMRYYLGYQEVLSKILPKSLKFKELTIRNSEVVLITDSGDFMLDAVSGGISALIDLSWQIYMYSTKERETFTVLIDEVENHLHAMMQREILPNFLSAFPNVQFIVSTHSPLIIGSVKKSAVYALRYNEQNKVFSERLDLVQKPKTAAEVLREVLGVSFTMPLWVEEELNNIVDKYSVREITATSLMELRSELHSMGLDNLIPETISSLVDKKHD